MKRSYRKPRTGEVESYLSTRVKFIKREGNELRFDPCPTCKHDNPNNPAVKVNLNSGLWRCFACEANGNWYWLTKQFNEPLPEGDRFDGEAFKKSYDVEWSRIFRTQQRPRRLVTEGHYPELLEYCHKRGFSDKTLDAYGVTTKGPTQLRWLIFSPGEANAWTPVTARIVRCLGDSGPKHYFEIKGGPTHLLIGNQLLDYREKYCVIFEGQWDAMSGYQIGLANCLSLPNGANNIDVQNALRYIPADWDVMLCLDQDDKGRAATDEFFAQLGCERLAKVNLPTKDLNEWLQAKPDLTKNDVLQCAKGFARSVSDSATEQSYFDVWNTETETMAKICELKHLPALNKALGGGLYEGEITGMISGSGSGKTTFVNQLNVSIANQGIKVGLISLEGPRSELARKIQMAAEHVPDRNIANIKTNLLISKLFGKKTTHAQIIEQVRQFIAAGCKLFFIDNIDFISDQIDPRKAQTAGVILDYCVTYRCHAFFVWQPNKIQQDKRVNSGDQKGDSKIFQDSDNYINFNKNPGEDFRILETEKCRHAGPGKRLYYRYDQDTNLYSEIDNVLTLPNKHNSAVGFNNLFRGRA